jgi:hypothetical protein
MTTGVRRESRGVDGEPFRRGSALRLCLILRDLIGSCG